MYRFPSRGPSTTSWVPNVTTSNDKVNFPRNTYVCLSVYLSVCLFICLSVSHKTYVYHSTLMFLTQYLCFPPKVKLPGMSRPNTVAHETRSVSTYGRMMPVVSYTNSKTGKSTTSAYNDFANRASTAKASSRKLL